MNSKNFIQTLEKWKFPILILLLGLGLMLFPMSETPPDAADDPQRALAEILSNTQGIGKTQVLISDTGVVVACTGAANASVRLDIIRAVSSYTGFGSDKITILKLKT